MKYLHLVAAPLHRIWYLDHRLTPEVRAMLCAMASRMPVGGIEARYTDIVEAVAKGLIADSMKAGGREGEEFPVNDVARGRAEDRLCEYPIHPAVQEFFDKFVLRYGHCYDDQTEVLCQDVGSGQVHWMLWKDVTRFQGVPNTDGEVRFRLAAFDPTTDSVRFEEPSAWVAKPYTGRMYKVKKERGNVDLLVTPKHTMLVRKREYVGGGRENADYEWSDWRGVKAEEVAGKTCYRYKRGAARMAETRDLTENEDPWGLSLVNLHAFGRLCGFFVGDGYAGGKQAGYLSFNIRKEREQSFLATIESDLGLKVQRDKNGRCHVHLEGARDWARTFFYHPSATVPSGKPAKDIPSWVYIAPEAFVRGFLEGLHNSDGSTVSEDSWRFANSSDPVTEGLQIIGTLWGCPVSIRGPYQEEGSKIAFVSGSKCLEPVVNRGRDRHEDGWEDYDGMVYCATVSTGFLIVRRNHATMVSGNSSILELTGSPSVYVEGVSWWAAYRSFDNALVAGQEFSTRAVRRRDWPMASECTDVSDVEYKESSTRLAMGWHPTLKALHDAWFEVFEAEVEAWKVFFSDAANRAAYGIKDKEPFRPALDRARWAIPGTIATGFAHTANLRTMARVIHDGQLSAQQSGAAPVIKVWDDIAAGYAAALPGMSKMGLREAVYDSPSDLDFHLQVSAIYEADQPDDVVVKFHQLRDFVSPAVRDRAPGAKTYLDPFYNQFGRVDIAFQCSLAVARDWHRHRTMMPWHLDIVWGEYDIIQLHHMYEPKSDLGKANLDKLLKMSTDAFHEFRKTGDDYRAMLCLPLGAKVQMSGQAGLRDAVYMLELRAFSHGASFEYSAQAKEAIRQLVAALGPEFSERIGLTAP